MNPRYRASQTGGFSSTQSCEQGGPSQRQRSGMYRQTGPGEQQDSRHSKSPHKAFGGKRDSEKGVFRRADVIKTRVLGLMINEANAELLLNSIPTEGEVSNFIKSSFRAWDRFVLQFAHESDPFALERHWMGCSEPLRPTENFQSGIIAKICISYYLTEDWEIVREMAYVAISEKALKVLGIQYRRLDILYVSCSP